MQISNYFYTKGEVVKELGVNQLTVWRWIKEGKLSGVYAFVEKKPVRLDGARKLMHKIEKDYKTLPFTERWLKDVKNIKFLLGILEKTGVLQQYKQLPEKSGGIVAQYENTVCVGKGIITKI